jgi:hypothetical protein
MIVPQQEMEGQWELFADQGSRWEPKGGARLIVLDVDDVLFMPLGYAIVHAVPP